MAVYYYGIADSQTVRRIEIEQIVYNDLQAGEALSRYDVVFMDGDYVKIAKADGDTLKNPAMGISEKQSAISGGTVDVMIRGVVSNASWTFASADVVYLSAFSGGLMTGTAPKLSGDWVQRMGISITPEGVAFNPETTPIQIAASN